MEGVEKVFEIDEVMRKNPMNIKERISILEFIVVESGAESRGKLFVSFYL